jgi:hypothetical protein
MKLKMPKLKSRKKLRFDRKFLARSRGRFWKQPIKLPLSIRILIEPMELKSKEAVADDILNKVIAYFFE